ncbi:hypothetical protein Ocin01_19874 [Orchesella cincta]|uniref:Uncharacterized protein n=1 Tax=Orchesella cincta TaxID=48709 RepID=A0A1D2M1G6_ORCCI|nr:hypothetical protein Ocin01_19874 [Orchesella cincta]
MESALKLLVANGDKYIPAAEMKMGDVASSEEIASVPRKVCAMLIAKCVLNMLIVVFNISY